MTRNLPFLAASTVPQCHWISGQLTALSTVNFCSCPLQWTPLECWNLMRKQSTAEWISERTGLMRIQSVKLRLARGSWRVWSLVWWPQGLNGTSRAVGEICRRSWILKIYRAGIYWAECCWPGIGYVWESFGENDLNECRWWLPDFYAGNLPLIFVPLTLWSTVTPSPSLYPCLQLTLPPIIHPLCSTLVCCYYRGFDQERLAFLPDWELCIYSYFLWSPFENE